MKKILLALVVFWAIPAMALNLDAVDGAANTQTQAEPTPQKTENCDDDSRLNNLGKLIRDIESGSVTDPITMTASRFAKLKPVIAKRLKNIMVCPNVAVLDGIVTERVTIPWATLKELVLAAAIKEDAQEIVRLLSSFRVQAMPADKIASLGSVIPGTAEMNKFLSKNLKIKLLPTERPKEIGGILFSDLYSIFGGKASLPSSSVYFVGGRAREEFVKKGGIILLQPNNKAAEATVQRLTPFGIRAFTDDREAFEALGE